jgi:A/G-specific adenine glycosylase
MRFSIDLIEWYNKNKRDLPWRNSNAPYKVWLSEIILQQTRVDQGLDYFNKFVDAYPTIQDLANASEDEVLKLWQGLGYYSRARNLHFTAKHITQQYNGIFPETYKDMLGLKGVGEYTAAAIMSFCYNQPYPVIDGNVYRVLSRIFGVETPIDSTTGKKEFKGLAEELIDLKDPATYNQAIMEFGALHCTPKTPKCDDCIFRLECFALKYNLVNQLPKKEKKLKQRNRFFNYLILKNGDNLYLKQRGNKDIWQGLYDFPLIESDKELNSAEKLQAQLNKSLETNTYITVNKQSESIKHILSHQKIYTIFWHIEVDNTEQFDKNYLSVSTKEINNYPVPKLIENYIKAIF